MKEVGWEKNNKMKYEMRENRKSKRKQFWTKEMNFVGIQWKKREKQKNKFQEVTRYTI